ncbi:amidohydrolase family protein [Streptomyces kaniharaensis]|uniref:Amidohydrolase family protein n=1 Tax=Streptomyces kaniharaensis TaxID=212423 RepID=A0A6N7KJS1_9ACTN|nr:amidohydrolase family protein [Streptomyces kaniharaensis]MQS10985.1 amidohydrolase family protein [Streptomyces kaniharaensis]
MDRLLLRDGHVLTMDPLLGDLPCADILVEDGRIAAVGPSLAADDAEVVDAAGCIVLPGFVDTHRHMWQAVLRGHGADQTLGEYFRVVLGTLGPLMGPHDLYLGNLLSALSALDAGITTVQDISNVGKPTQDHSDAVIAGLVDSGIRARHSYGQGTEADLRRLRAAIGGGDSLVTLGLNAEPSDEHGTRRAWALADELDLPIALHARGYGTVDRLHRLTGLHKGTVYIHGNGLGGYDLDLIAQSGGALSVAPAIEMTMGHGLPPFREARDAGVRTSLSTDVEVAAAADMFTQMRAAFQTSRYAALHHGGSERDLPTCRQILEYATIGGARALGLEDRVGSLTPGKSADLVVLRADRPGVVPVYDAARTVVSAMDRGDVDSVLVAGTFRKRAGRLTHASLASVLEQAGAVRDRLRREHRR